MRSMRPHVGLYIYSYLVRSMRPHVGLYIYIYTNKAKRNLFVCLSGMAGHALYGMAPCFGHTGITFDAENDRPGPDSLQGHFEAA